MHNNQPPIIDPEFRDLMPPLTEDEYQQLEQNILSARKCHDAILLWNGIIVDGFNRFCVCAAHSIQFEVKDINFASRDDAKIWIIENQLGRRNLNPAHCIELALTKADMLREKARENQSLGGKRNAKLFPKTDKTVEEPINVHKAVSKDADVGKSTIHRYLQIKSSGNTTLLEAVQSGELKIGTAHRLLMPQIKKEMRQADKMLAYINERLPLENEEHNQYLHQELTLLAEQIKEFVACLN